MWTQKKDDMEDKGKGKAVLGERDAYTHLISSFDSVRSQPPSTERSIQCDRLVMETIALTTKEDRCMY